jgi:hypothetical protein
MRRPTLDTILASVGLVVVALAVVSELRRSPQLRTWHGTVLGVVPYDFRRPTFRRVHDALWSPDDDRILVPRALGVGWSVNLARLVRLVRQRAQTHRRDADHAS